jgi:2,4-didehydro-3-deoxy-L-rhamnonate hydrolase
VSPDEFDDPNDIAFGCELNGKEMQRGRTSDLIYSVPELIAFLSSIVTLLPGDLLFTGTPSGVGHARTPPVFLQVGDRLRTWADGIGEMTQTFHGSA